MYFEIVKGSASYLLVCLNVEHDGKTLSGKEIIDVFGPCAAIAYAPTKKKLVELCKRENLNLI